MRFRRHLELEHGLKPIDIAPLINIAFLALIFFMLTYTFVMQPGLKVNLPRTITSEAGKYENLEITISADSSIYIHNKILTLQELKTLLNQTVKAKGSVLIRADRRTPLDRIVEIWDMCRDLGMAQINIVTNQK